MISIAKKYDCSTCAQSFTTQGNLNHHRKESSTCGIAGLGAHGCTGCGAKFQYSSDLSDHGRFCGGRKCETCNKDVYKNESLVLISQPAARPRDPALYSCIPPCANTCYRLIGPVTHQHLSLLR